MSGSRGRFEEKRSEKDMSDLAAIEKRKLERLLGMGSGYVLDFSNRTFQEFVLDSVVCDIYDKKYNYGSGSKANCLRGFWNEEPNHLVAKLLKDLINYGVEIEAFKNDPATLLADCQCILERLSRESSVHETDALLQIGDVKDFRAVLSQIKAAINSDQPENALDRLHTFLTKYVRLICAQRGIDCNRDKPLHGLFGEYIKSLKGSGHIESEMTERILKSSIAIFEAFNHVRNNQSLAHDNPILNYDESLLIFNHIAASLRFLQSLESRVETREKSLPFVRDMPEAEDIPF